MSPATAAWTVEGDVLALGPLQLALQRIALSHWRAGERLRSWGTAPLARERGRLCLPCAGDEALWLGAWVEEGEARVRLIDPLSGGEASLVLPRDYQLAALADLAGTPQPLTLAAGGAARRLRLELDCGGSRAVIELLLLAPAAWAARCGRPAPPPLDEPPPLPPRLG